MKKLFSCLAAVIMSISAITAINVNADDETEYPISDPIIEEYQYTSCASSVTSTSGNTAYCSSSCVGITGVYRISGMQYLEKKSGFLWIPIENWSGNSYSNMLDMDNSKSGLSSGTYHTKTSFLVYYGNTSETITITGLSASI